jgi:hypothetical protein
MDPPADACRQFPFRCTSRAVIDGGHTKDGYFVGTRALLDPGRRLSRDEMVLQHQQRTVANFVELRRLSCLCRPRCAGTTAATLQCGRRQALWRRPAGSSWRDRVRASADC